MIFKGHVGKVLKKAFLPVFLLSLFFCGFSSLSSDVSAYNLGSRGKVWITGGYVDKSYISITSSTNGVSFINGSNSSGWVNRVCANFGSSLPGDTIVNISMRFNLTDAGSIGTVSPDQYWGVVNSSVSQYDKVVLFNWQLWNSNGNVQSVCFDAANLYWAGGGSRVDISGGDYYYVVDSATESGQTDIYNLLNAQKNNVVDIANTSLQTYSLLQAQKNNVVDIANASISMDSKLSTLTSSSSSIATNTQTTAQETAETNNKIDQQNQDISSQTTADIQGSTDANTQNLLSALTGFAGVIGSLNPSDCKLNANLGHVNLGLLDFCQDSPPSFVTIIGSLILCFILIGFCYAMVQKILSLVREMQT